MALPEATEYAWRQALRRKAKMDVFCHETVEDIVQETLIAFWQRTGLLPWEYPQGTECYKHAWVWCCLKVRSLIINKNALAYKRYERLLVDAEGGEQLAFVDDSDDWIKRLALEQFFAVLPDYLRAVAEMYEAGYTYREISAHIGVSVGTVQGYLGRIRKFGRAFFDAEGNKQGECAVNDNVSPDMSKTNLSQEVRNDETTQDTGKHHQCPNGSESHDASPHLGSHHRSRRGGGYSLQVPSAISVIVP